MGYTLRLTQTSEGQNKYRVEVALEGDELPRQIAAVRFDFELTRQDQKDLRWYLEDFLQYPLDPAPKIAARIENRMVEIGTKLFTDIFKQGDDVRDLWATLRERLDDTRVEIITEVREAAAIPWELIRDPKTDTPLSLRARSFVRTHSQASQRPKLPQTATGPIRILLVICRPGGTDDVPFRSVASRLIKGLSDAAREIFQLDVLRPPTFEQLSRVLRAAKDRGQPYHVVHFDGHGIYADVSNQGNLSELLGNLSRLLLSGQRTGAHGYLLFENPAEEKNAQLIDGSTLGKLLVETHVPVLVLNACRSAHTDPQTEPVAVEPDEDPHAKVRAFGSFAHEVMDAGVAGVVAMRYNVYVVTAAQFVAELYASLTHGYKLGDAVTIGRKQLAAQPLREIAYDPLALQDWPVPVVYEAAPIALFPKTTADKKLTIRLSKAEATPSRDTLDAKLPASPDAGFFGRDETLLALDRAFDTQSIVLLHAYAGNGKTSTAAEFARWYSLTGGVNGPVLFTSFEQYKPMARVLDEFERIFGKPLEQAGVNWLALSDDERRDVALQVLRQIPVLWIWDNVEPVAGFPAGTQSSWSAAEHKELADFLRAARDTQARFLLTSRRDEREWLGDLPARVTLPRMPMQERVQLARALAEKHGRRLIDVDDWRPLLEFTQGNPMTITVLVGQALRDGLKAKEQIEAFVGKLRAGEAVFEDEASEGRSKSLGASLSYGFDNAFSVDERKQLALLHFFQGFVAVGVICVMGGAKATWCLPEIRGLTHEAGIALLDRAAEVGLLTSQGNGYYSIHPAVPWFFKKLFDYYYPAPSNLQSTVINSQLSATRAFVEAMNLVGSYYQRLSNRGQEDAVYLLMNEEPNLLRAKGIAQINEWYDSLLGSVQGLYMLYERTGRRSEMLSLVDEILPNFVTPDSDGPILGREEGWSVVTGYRVSLSRHERRWAEAERLQRLRTNFNRQRALRVLDHNNVTDEAGIGLIQNLATSLEQLGHILRQQEKPECVTAYEEANSMYQRIGLRPGEAIIAFNIGGAYLDIPKLYNPARAEEWYMRSLDLTDKNDVRGIGQCLVQLGKVKYYGSLDTQIESQALDSALRHLEDSKGFLMQALAVLPTHALDDLAQAHHQLGIVLRGLGELDLAFHHYQKAIRFSEASGDVYSAARCRRNFAKGLAFAGRFTDAREYAYVALNNFRTYGDRATEDIQATLELIAAIEQNLPE